MSTNGLKLDHPVYAVQADFILDMHFFYKIFKIKNFIFAVLLFFNLTNVVSFSTYIVYPGV